MGSILVVGLIWLGSAIPVTVAVSRFIRGANSRVATRRVVMDRLSTDGPSDGGPNDTAPSTGEKRGDPRPFPAARSRRTESPARTHLHSAELQ